MAVGVFGFVAMNCVCMAAEPLKSATVTHLRNEVLIAREGQAEHAAAERDTVAGKDVLRTGKKSRAELEFADKSIARLGSNTIFSFNPQGREMSLQRGAALIHVPPGLSGARISSPAATAAIRGDVVAMRVAAGGITQIVALSRDASGPVTVTFHKTGETRTLEPGQMLTINPSDVRLPEPMHMNVDVFVQSSALVQGADGFSRQLPEVARQEIRQAESRQHEEIRTGVLEGGTTAVARTEKPGASLARAVSDENTAVQAATGSRFAGRYLGTYQDVPPALNGGRVDCTITPDGRMSGMTYNNNGSAPSPFSGTIGTDGSFKFFDQHGEPGTGAIDLKDLKMTGTVYHPSSSGPQQATVNGDKVQ
jgi:hypothetical protein